MLSSPINFQDVEALIDLELTLAEEISVCAAMADQPVLKRYYLDMLGQKTLLKRWWLNSSLKN